MKPIAIVGLVLVIAGGFVLVNGGGFDRRESVLKIGDLNVTAEKHHSIPNWAGALALGGGVLLLGAGLISKK